MLHIDNFHQPASIAEAYETLRTVPGSVILGGCGYLRLANRRIDTAIDLSRLGLDTITQTDNMIEIGAMTTLRSFETDRLLTGLADGVLARSVKGIVGVQLRNCVTAGGTVAGRYPFSDPITAMVALDAELQLHNQGRVSLEEYLSGKSGRDIVTRIIIADDSRRAAFTSIRKSATDYAILNCAVARRSDSFRVVVGSRPGRAMRATQAEEYLLNNGLTPEHIEEAARLAAAELQFGDNPRGSAEYRLAVCPVLVKRALMEVLDAA